MSNPMQVLKNTLGPDLMDKLDRAAVAETERFLDGLTDALAKDLANSPDVSREQMIMDIGAQLCASMTPEQLSAALSLAAFRVVEAHRANKESE